MFKIILSVLLFATSFCFAQETVTAEVKESKITTLTYTVDSLEELKTINWEDVKKILKDNKASVQLGFRVKNESLEEDNQKFKHSFEIKSKAENIEGSIEIAKRVIKILEKI